ncbi:MAG TPA: LPS export ABC transporter periplasmic protein LptC, partial [Thermoanaerobaculia bacterium]
MLLRGQDMQRSIRILRIALPVVILAFVALIVFSWTRKDSKRNQAVLPPVAGSRGSEQPLLESKQFEDTQTIGGRVVSRIRATRVVAYESNWSTLEGVELTIYRANGKTYELSCPQAQFNSVTKHADAKGGVKVTSTDGIEIQTAEIQYDGNRLTNDIPVQFKVDRWTGNGGALDLDVGGETLKLFKKVTATMTPVLPTESPMTLAGEEALFRRKDNDVAFTQRVTMRRLADSLAADRIVGRFSQDRKTLVALEGTGAVDIVLASTDGGPMQHDASGRKHITCDRFYSELGADGQISAINAVGDAQYAHAVMAGPPVRDLVAKSFRFAIANKRVSEMKADW